MTTSRISYTKANEFIKLLDEERSAQELTRVLVPGTYYIGSGDGVIQWDGTTAYHAPPNGDVEMFDYLKKSDMGRGFASGSSQRSDRDDFDSFGGRGMDRLAHDVAGIQNGRSGGLQSSLQSGRGQAAEMDSPWSRGWAEAERQEKLRR